MRVKLPALVKPENKVTSAGVRTKTSKRAAALLASSLLEDVELVTTEDKSMVIAPSEVQRGRKALLETVTKDFSAELWESGLRALYYDGRDDETLISHKQGNTFHRTTKKEHHVVLVGEPGAQYLGHVTTKTKEGVSTKEAAQEYFEEKGIETLGLLVLGCDETLTNTGWKSGSTACIEKAFDKLLQRVVCLLHAVELPLRPSPLSRPG